MIPQVDWWLDRARGFVRTYEGTLQDLGKALARHVPDKKKFDHAQLSRFRDGQIGATWELMIAICIEFDLLPPVFVTRSENEASEMSKIFKKYSAAKEPVAVGAPPARQSLADIIQFPKKKQPATAKRTRSDAIKRVAR